jgi:hypothetical protein
MQLIGSSADVIPDESTPDAWTEILFQTSDFSKKSLITWIIRSLESTPETCLNRL